MCQKKGVPDVLGVPITMKPNVSKGFDGTQNIITPEMQHVPGVPQGALRTQEGNAGNIKGVPINISNNSMLHVIGTQEHVEHVKNNLSALGRETFEECAAIMEFDGGMTRGEAERLAYQDIMTIVTGGQ